MSWLDDIQTARRKAVRAAARKIEAAEREREEAAARLFGKVVADRVASRSSRDFEQALRKAAGAKEGDPQ